MTKKVNSGTAMLGVVFASLTMFCLSAPRARAQSQPLARLQGDYAFRMTPAESFSPISPGNVGGIATAPRQDILRVGVLTADGNGNLTGHTIATTDTNGGDTWMVTFDWTGKYTVNSNGTGFFSVDAISNLVCTDTTVAPTGSTPHPVTTGGTPLLGNIACPASPAVEGQEDYAFVFTTPGKNNFEFIETDNAGGGAKIFLTGVAHHQPSMESPVPVPGNGSGNGNGNGDDHGNGRG